MKKATLISSVLIFAVCIGGLIGAHYALSGDSNSKYKERTTITFYGWGNESEVALTKQFVEDYNNSQDKIFVKYTSIPSDDYQTKIDNALYSRTPPDVLLAGDGEIKPWIELGALAELDDYIENSSVFDLSDFWQEGQNRYYYNIKRRMNSTPEAHDPDAHYYGIMRDLSPTVLFYNKTAFEKVGITVISMSKEESMQKYGNDHGFFAYEDGYIFNNQIAMTYDEMLECARINTFNTSASSANRNPKASTTYGVHYVNWFSLGWSVGANSLQWVRDDSYSLGGYYVFSLDDNHQNYSVKEGKTVVLGKGTARETTYHSGELIKFDNLQDVIDEFDNEQIDEFLYRLPSSLKATQDYVDLSAKYRVAPRPDFTNSASVSQYSIFTSGNQSAMIADSRYAVGIYRNLIKDKFEWDCAPLPYYEHGIPSGHSGSLAICISEKSQNKKAAFEFIEYLNGIEGQTAFAEAGFTIPNTKSLSNSNVFLQKRKDPQNSKLFVEAAEYQTVGDWGFLPSKTWITPWANVLNSRVLNGDMTLVDCCNQTRGETQSIIDGYYSSINKKVK